MAYVAGAYNDLRIATKPQNCGGLMRWKYRGPHTVVGVTQDGAVATPCRVFLYADDGTLLGYARSNSTGSYAFLGLAEGDYYLVIKDDQRGAHRAKVEHLRLGSYVPPVPPLPVPEGTSSEAAGGTLVWKKLNLVGGSNAALSINIPTTWSLITYI